MNDIVKIEYEQAKYVFENFMSMVKQYVTWPNKELVRCFTISFSALLDGLGREQNCLVEALRRKEQRINELEANTWAELEEVEEA